MAGLYKKLFGRGKEPSRTSSLQPTSAPARPERSRGAPAPALHTRASRPLATNEQAPREPRIVREPYVPTEPVTAREPAVHTLSS